MKIGDTVILKDNILDVRERYSWFGSTDYLRGLIGKQITVEDISNNLIVYNGIYIPKNAVYTLSEYRALKIKDVFDEKG